MTFTSFMTGLGAGVGGALGMGSDVGAAIGNRVGSLFEWDVSQTDSERQAQEDGNNERDRIYAANQSLANGFTGEYAAQVVPPVMETFNDMSHERIMQFVNSINVESLGTSIDGWTTLANDTKTKGQAFHDNIEKEMERGWSGSAATQALASTKSYLTDVGKVEQAARLIANKMEEARSGLQQVKYSVPHESDDQSSSKLGIVTSVLSPALGLVIDATSSGRSNAAEESAREVMNTVYKPVAQQSDTQVPKVPQPADPSSGKPNDPGDDDNPTGGGNPNTDDPGSTKPTTEDPSTDDPTTEDPATEDPSTEDPSTEDPSDDDTSDDDTNPSSTQPETPTTTDPGTVPAGTTPSGLTPGGGSPGGSPGGGLPSGGTPSGTPGTPTAGTPGSPNAGGTIGGTTSGASGGRGMMGGMGAPGGRGGGRDEDDEHNAPDYLRGVHEELLGPDRLHVPPVIGGDA
ncbi:hypothetical protein ACFXK0_23585 [Nocardia sp. NPDC059177]|uniref:hypothetical protein n=1 Tax=Nocardia sp. NPDC059177 TaxID=3346759 RepID=UPI0036A2CCA0